MTEPVIVNGVKQSGFVPLKELKGLFKRCPPEVVLERMVFVASNGTRRDGLTSSEWSALKALLAEGSMEEQMAFLFRVYDATGSGTLTRPELSDMLKVSAGASKLALSERAVDDAVCAIMDALCVDGSDELSLAAFMSVMVRYPALAESMNKSLAAMVGAGGRRPGDADAAAGSGSGVQARLARAWRRVAEVASDPAEYWVQAALYLALLGMAGWAVADYHEGFYRDVMGPGIIVSRICAYVIRLAFAALIVTVSFQLITFLRDTPLRHVINFDRNVDLHKALGVIIGVCALTHAIAHFTNYARASSPGVAHIWAANGRQQPTLGELYNRPVTITGFLMLGIMAIAYLFALEWPKRWLLRVPKLGALLHDFNAFWYTHQLLWISWVVLLMIHPYPGVPGQTSTNRTWMFVAIPLALYLAERGWRLFMRTLARRSHMEVVAAVPMPGDVVQLVLRPRGRRFRFTPGQYAYINCPDISSHEWHPFTLSSAPEDEFVTLHVRAVGDWTRALHARAKETQAALASAFSRRLARPTRMGDLAAAYSGAPGSAAAATPTSPPPADPSTHAHQPPPAAPSHTGGEQGQDWIRELPHDVRVRARELLQRRGHNAAALTEAMRTLQEALHHPHPQPQPGGSHAATPALSPAPSHHDPASAGDDEGGHAATRTAMYVALAQEGLAQLMAEAGEASCTITLGDAQPLDHGHAGGVLDSWLGGIRSRAASGRPAPSNTAAIRVSGDSGVAGAPPGNAAVGNGASRTPFGLQGAQASSHEALAGTGAPTAAQHAPYPGTGTLTLAPSHSGHLPGGSVVMPRIWLDGPYGAPSQRYDDYEVLVLVAAGIGVTPMASILRHLTRSAEAHRCRHCHKVSLPRSFWLRKVYFHWTVREANAPEWFKESLQEVAARDDSHLCDINVYFTGGTPDNVTGLLMDLARTLRHEQDSMCIVSGVQLRTKTHFGRPDFEAIIRDTAARHPDSRIGVLFCGPTAIARVLRGIIRRTPHPSITLHKENF